MKAAFFAAPGRIELREVGEPEPRAAEVLVQVRRCGVCGSDLHFFHGESPAPRGCPGHEIAGDVVAVGEGVGAEQIGRRVAVEPLVVCGRCWYCRTGSRQLCRRLRLIGLTRAGGFAERVAVPADAIFPLPDALDYAAGALVEPAAVCVHGVRLGGVGFGSRVLVLGGGTIGLLSLLAARAAGAGEVAVTARYPHQAETARRLGAARVFEADGEGESSLAEYAAKREPDVVIETVGGRAETLSAAVRHVRPGGSVVVLGVFSDEPRLPAVSLLVKEVRMIGSMTYDRVGARSDFELALDLLAAHPGLADALVTHSVPLDAIEDGFRIAADKSRGSIKVTVEP